MEGYTKTEIGEIPKHWKLVTLGEMGEFSKGRGLAKKDLSNEGIPCVRYGELYTEHHYVIKEFKSFIPENKKKEGTLLEKGDILFAGSGETLEDIGKSVAFISEIEAYAGGDIIIYKSKQFDSVFLGFCLNQEIINKQRMKLGQGNSVVHIYAKHLASLILPFPPLPEQKRIAKILSTVDEKIENIDQQIAETEQLKKGMMQRLLTKGIGHTEFKDSPLGEIPKSWEVVKIEDIAEVKGGKRLPKGESLIEEVTNHPYIRVADMYMGGINLDNILHVPDDIFPSISRYIINKDDLFISVAGTLGIVGEVPSELDGANLTENADKLTNIRINKAYLLQVLLSPIIQDAVKREQTNNAQPKLALTRIKTFLVPKPQKEEQQKIASILSTIDEKIEAQIEKKSAYLELKKGLMQQLLTGKKRVQL